MSNQFKIEEQLVIISIPTIRKLLSYGKDGANALLLYNFYYYTAKWQKTNQAKATANYCMTGLHWGEDKFLKADKILRELNLVKKVINKDETGKIEGWYVQIGYIWTTEKERVIKPEPPKTTPVEKVGAGKQGTNAYSVSNRNAYNVSNEIAGKPAGLGVLLNKTIELFKEVNPNYERLFSNKTQRGALERMIKKFGVEEVEKIISILPQTNARKFFSVITTPYQLEEKMGNLKAQIQESNNKSNSKVGEPYKPI